MRTTEPTADLLMAAARGLRRRFTTVLAEWDVTPGQSRALRAVCSLSPVRLSTLATVLDIAPRSATEVVDALEARGLVTREPDAADRRATRVLPTEEGQKVLALIESARAEESARYLERLSVDDRAELDRILRALTGDEAPVRHHARQPLH